MQSTLEPQATLEVPDVHSVGGMTDQEAIAYGRLKAFYTNIMKKLAPPLRKEVEASSLRPDAEPFTPKRTMRASKRNAAASTTKAKPAENVLLHTLGLVPDDMVPNEEAVIELKRLFDSPLREQHVRVLAALFGKTLPLAEELASGRIEAVSVV